MEYFQRGSVLTYLRSNAATNTIHTKLLLKFAKGIASGMEYLVSKGVIHRDLAARNILLDNDDDCAKISDFGLSRMADTYGYYVVKSDLLIPYKWYVR